MSSPQGPEQPGPEEPPQGQPEQQPPPGQPPQPPPGQPQQGQPPQGQPQQPPWSPGSPPPQPPGQGAPPPGYGYGQPPGAVAGSQLSPQDERTWGMLAHIGAILAALIALSFLGPLIVLLVQGPKSAFVRRHAVESLNFQITTYIALIVSAVLIIVLIGFLMLLAVFILWLVFSIKAGVAAGRGEDYRYPLNIRLIS